MMVKPRSPILKVNGPRNLLRQGYGASRSCCPAAWNLVEDNPEKKNTQRRRCRDYLPPMFRIKQSTGLGGGATAWQAMTAVLVEHGKGVAASGAGFEGHMTAIAEIDRIARGIENSKS